MPAANSLNGPVRSVITPRVMESAVTPGPPLTPSAPVVPSLPPAGGLVALELLLPPPHAANMRAPDIARAMSFGDLRIELSFLSEVGDTDGVDSDGARGIPGGPERQGHRVRTERPIRLPCRRRRP